MKEKKINLNKILKNQTMTIGLFQIPFEVETIILKNDEGEWKYNKSKNVNTMSENNGERTFVYLNDKLHMKITKVLFDSAIKTIKSFFDDMGELYDFSNVEFWITKEKDNSLIIKYNEMAIAIAPRNRLK